MTADPIFYTEVTSSVQAVLDTRKRYYSSDDRSSSAHEWLFKKMAWASAVASNEARGPVEIVAAEYGGLPKSGKVLSGRSGVYESQSSYNLKFFPRPQIESVNVSAEGDFGSIIKLELKFQVHRLATLTTVQPFFDIGGDLVVRWGWNRAGGAGGKNGYFEGKIYNFSYNVNSAGGFDCTTYAMMAGITIIGGNADAPTNESIQGLTDANGNILTANSIISKYVYEAQLLSTKNPTPTEPGPVTSGSADFPTGGVQLVKYAKDWAEAKDPTGIPDLSPAQKAEQARNIAGKSVTTVYIGNSGVFFNSNTAKLTGYLLDGSPIYEVTDSTNATREVVKNTKTGTYNYFTSGQRYPTPAAAAAARQQQPQQNQTSSGTTQSSTNKTTPQLYLYVSLERLVADINKLAEQNSSWFKTNNVRIICNGDITKGLVPSDTTRLVSANPTEVLFPGYATYGVHTFSFGTIYEDAVKNNGDLSKFMISLKWLQDTMSKIGTEKSKNTKSADSSVASLLQKVFDLIYKHSGERFRLSMITKPNSSIGTEILIVDVNYIDLKSPNVKIYEITAVDRDSIARSISLQSKVPNEFQTAAFVSANNAFSGPNAGSIAGVIGAIPGQNTNPPQPAPQTLEQATSALDSVGVTPNNVKSLQAALKQERISYGKSDSGVGKEIIPFPLDFSVTLDGIDGFIFGNTITCNYLPAIYKKPGTLMAFTVTKVNHTIANNDWTTTLNTVCRIVS